MRRAARVMVLIVGCAIVLCAGPAGADDVLLSVNANFLSTSFTASGGDYSLGVLTVDDNADIVVEYNTGQVTFDNGDFLLTTSLFSDNSAGGIVGGLFKGGSIVIRDSAAQNLLTADVISLRLDEVAAQPDVLAGAGSFRVTGGSLSFPEEYGDIVQIVFNVSPTGVVDYSSDFSGVSNVTLSPIPEPGTLFLLGTGILIAFGVIRRRRMQ